MSEPSRRTVFRQIAVAVAGAGAMVCAAPAPAAPVPKVAAKPKTFTAQEGWRWCKKCEGMFFAEGEGKGTCPAGKEHDGSESGRYAMLIAAEGGQAGWRRCTKCEGLFYGGEKRRGSCPAGKEHDPDAVEYVSCTASSEIPPGKE